MVYPKVKLNPVEFASNYAVLGNQRWRAASLVAYAKDLEPFDVPLAALPIGSPIWNVCGSPADLADEIRRTLDVDLSHPIILDEGGRVMDGWHRVVKALIEGHTTIKAVRFEKNPPADYIAED